ncbi:MAG: hypothetical protein ACQESR_06355 [Planctomycetota bacterium]
MTRMGVLIGVVVTSFVLSIANDSFAQTGRRSSRSRNRSISRPTATDYADLFRSGYGDYRGFGSSDPRWSPYLRQNRSSASRVPDRNRGQSNTRGQTGDPAVARAQAARAGRAGMSGTEGTAGQGGVAPTGIGSVFMQHAHYYQMQNYGSDQQGARRRPRGR